MLSSLDQNGPYPVPAAGTSCSTGQQVGQVSTLANAPQVTGQPNVTGQASCRLLLLSVLRCLFLQLHKHKETQKTSGTTLELQQIADPQECLEVS